MSIIREIKRFIALEVLEIKVFIAREEIEHAYKCGKNEAYSSIMIVYDDKCPSSVGYFRDKKPLEILKDINDFCRRMKANGKNYFADTYFGDKK